MPFVLSIHTVKRRVSLRATVGALVGILPIVFLLGLLSQNHEQLDTLAWTFDWATVLTSFLLYSLALFVAVWVWGRLMNALGGATTWSNHFSAYCSTNAARRVPLLPWHIIGRAYIYEAHGIPKLITSIASMIELGLITIAGLLISISTLPSVLNLTIETFTLTLVFLLVCLWIFGPVIARKILNRFGGPEYKVHLTIVQLSVNITGYMAVWLLGGLTLYFTSNIITSGYHDHVLWFLTAWTTSGVAATVLSLSPFSLGIREVTLAYMLATIMPISLAILLTLTSRVILTAYEIFWSGLSRIVMRLI